MSEPRPTRTYARGGVGIWCCSFTTFRNQSGNAIGLNFGQFRMTTKVGVPPCLKFNVHLQIFFRSLRTRRYTFKYFPARFARGGTPSKNFPLATLAEVHVHFFSRSLRERKYTLKNFRTLRSQRYTLNFKFLLTPQPISHQRHIYVTVNRHQPPRH